MKKALIAAFVLGLSPAASAAQSSGPLVLHLPGSTRALGLGGAYVTTSADADAIFYNPALLLNGRGLSGATQWYGSGSKLLSFAGALDANSGFGVQILDYDVPARTSIGRPADVGADAAFGATGYAATIGHARAIKRVRIGLAGKYAAHAGTAGTTGDLAFDVGSFVSPFNWLTVALAGQNIPLGYESSCDAVDGCVTFDLPTRVVLNVATRSRIIGELDGLLAGYVAQEFDADVTGGLGLELSYWPIPNLFFVGRAGARINVDHGRFAAGGSITYQRYSLDYGFEPFTGRAAHRLGIRVR